jgi:hypothetical protein
VILVYVHDKFFAHDGYVKPASGDILKIRVLGSSRRRKRRSQVPPSFWGMSFLTYVGFIQHHKSINFSCRRYDKKTLDKKIEIHVLHLSDYTNGYKHGLLCFARFCW